MIIDEAQEIVHGSRRTEYGEPSVEFPRMAAMWSGVLGIPITAEQVCLCLIAGKLMRLSTTSTHHDSLVDIVGYSLILEELVNAKVTKRA